MMDYVRAFIPFTFLWEERFSEWSRAYMNCTFTESYSLINFGQGFMGLLMAYHLQKLPNIRCLP